MKKIHSQEETYPITEGSEQKKSILIEIYSPEQFMELLAFVFRKELENLKIELDTQSEKDDLLIREQALELLQIDPSTLWHWQNKGRIKVYKIANKCYYKRSEILASLTSLNK